MSRRSLLKDDDPIRRVDRDTPAVQQPGAVKATDDHELIRQWAAQRGAEPATGEATRSGPATRDVRDGGAGIRFNFAGAGHFRPITWDEWFQNFTEHDLIFVYEEDAPGKPPGNRYRLVSRNDLQDREKLY